MDAHREDSRQRRLVAKHNVGGGKTQVTAELVAMCNATGHDVRPSEQPCRVLEISNRKRGSHGATRRTFAIGDDGRHGFDTVIRRFLPQQRQVAGAVAAEAKVVSDQNPTYSELAYQHLVDEFL